MCLLTTWHVTELLLAKARNETVKGKFFFSSEIHPKFLFTKNVGFQSHAGGGKGDFFGLATKIKQTTTLFFFKWLKKIPAEYKENIFNDPQCNWIACPCGEFSNGNGLFSRDGCGWPGYHGNKHQHPPQTSHCVRVHTALVREVYLSAIFVGRNRMENSPYWCDYLFNHYCPPGGN